MALHNYLRFDRDTVLPDSFRAPGDLLAHEGQQQRDSADAEHHHDPRGPDERHLQRQRQ